MKESVWGYWIVVLGISIMSIMVLLQNLTTTSEQDYYMIKEALSASMYDAVDYGYYRDTGELKMNQEKFQENFLRRFAESVNINKTYNIVFYDIYEQPPAVSLAVVTKTQDTNFGQSSNATANSESANVANRLTGILYTNSKYQPRS